MYSLFLKYFFKQKKYILFFALILLSGIVISSVSKIENDKNTKMQIEILERIIESDKLALEHDKEKLKEDNLSEEEKEEIEKYQKRYSEFIEDNKSYIDKIKNSDWQYLYEEKLKDLKNYENDENYTSTLGDKSGITYEVNNLSVKITLETVKYLKKYNIPSAHPLFLQRTEFDQPNTSAEKNILDYYSKKNFVGTSHRLWDFMNNNLVLVYIFIIVVGPGMLFAGLEDNKNKTIRFLRTSGVSKFKIVFSGLVVGIFVTLGILVLMLGMVAGIEFLVSGPSSFKYPIVTYYPVESYFSMSNMGYSIVTISKVLIKSLKLLALYGIFIFLLSSLVSMILKSTLKSAIATFGIILSLQMFPKFNNPFSYWRIGKVVDGSINVLHKTMTYSYNKSIRYLTIGICVLAVVLLVTAFVENRQFFKRRIKNA